MLKQLRQRVGAIGKKVGMSQIFDSTGAAIPVTFIQLEPNIVMDVSSKDEVGTVTVAAFKTKEKNLSKQQLSMFKKSNTEPMRRVKEFKITSQDLPKSGDFISVNHFVVGQSIDVTGVSIGRGFTGVMKRHNFAGLEATHGISISHRAHGSTGQCQDPGKVFKGKKMAGHYGTEKVTVQNLEIVDVDPELNLVAIRGCVPGGKGSELLLQDSIKKALPAEVPFPTFYEKTKAE